MLRKLLLIALVACNADAAGPAPIGDGAHVLFVGNSLSYWNDMPAMVQALGASAGIALDVQIVGKPNFSLEDHWADGEALAAIARGGWDVVILQQGPSALAASRVNLLQWADSFNVRIRAIGARPALYQVWPAGADLATNFNASLESYRLAAVQVNGQLLPAGGAWQRVWATTPSLGLYGPDQFHPSWLGSYVAAITIYGGLTGNTPVGLPASVGSGSTSAATAALVQTAAADALAAAGVATVRR